MNRLKCAARCGLHAMLLLSFLAAGIMSLDGCAGIGFSAGEVELLESSAADARFMARTWAERADAERLEFARANAERWTLFNDLVHGRRPAERTAEGGAP